MYVQIASIIAKQNPANTKMNTLFIPLPIMFTKDMLLKIKYRKLLNR